VLHMALLVWTKPNCENHIYHVIRFKKLKYRGRYDRQYIKGFETVQKVNIRKCLLYSEGRNPLSELVGN